MTDERRQIMSQEAPFSEEAEEAVIGAVLINPDAFYGVHRFLKKDDFYFLRHQYIWEAMVAIHRRDEPVDYLLLSQELKRMDWLEAVGGMPYLTRLINNTPTSIHAEFYGSIVESTAIRRRLLTAADEVKALAHNEKLDIEQVQQQSLARLSGVVEAALSSQNPMMTLAESLEAHFEQVTHAIDHPDEFAGVASVIPEINTMNEGGYWNSELYVYAGRPGMGKSSVLMTEAFHIAIDQNKRVAYFTLEMPNRSLMNVLMAQRANITGPRKILRGRMSPQEYQRYVETAGQLVKTSGTNLIVDDTPGLTPLMLKTRCTLIEAQGGLDAIFVDYVQLMNGGKEGDYHNRQQEIGYITRSLKELAKTFNCPVLTASQINKAVDTRQDKRPLLSDMREADDIANDADEVFGVYNGDYYDNPHDKPRFSKLELIPLKGRDADITGVVYAWFEGGKKRILPENQVMPIPDPQPAWQPPAWPSPMQAPLPAASRADLNGTAHRTDDESDE